MLLIILCFIDYSAMLTIYFIIVYVILMNSWVWIWPCALVMCVISCQLNISCHLWAEFSLSWVVESVPYTLIWCWCQFSIHFLWCQVCKGLHQSPNMITRFSLYVYKSLYLTMRTSWSAMKYLYLVTINYTIGIVT